MAVLLSPLLCYSSLPFFFFSVPVRVVSFFPLFVMKGCGMVFAVKQKAHTRALFLAFRENGEGRGFWAVELLFDLINVRCRWLRLVSSFDVL